MLTVLAGLFMIGFLVVIHEAGHFVAAKIFKVGVPVFSVGMGPRLFGFQWGGTDYRISALPVGGYVQMAGADPFGEEDIGQEVPEDEDFMRKPGWQRLIIMAAGPGVNLALPFVLFTVLLMMGRPDWNSRIGAVLPGTPAAEAGFITDDVVRAVDGEPIDVWHDLDQALAGRLGTEGPVTFEVERGSGTAVVTVDASVLRALPEGAPDVLSLGLQSYYLSTRVGVEAADSPAGRAGLLTGDRILSVDGAKVETWEELQQALASGEAHDLTFVRSDDDDLTADPELEEADAQQVRVALDGRPYVAPHGIYANPWGLGPISVFARTVEEGAPAAHAGVQPGDRFLTVDGDPVLTFSHFVDLVARTAHDSPSDTPRPLALTVVRDGQIASMTMTPQVRVVPGEPYSRPVIGVGSYRWMGVAIDQVRKYYGLFEAIPRAVDESMAVVHGTAAILGNIFTGQADPRDNVGGPVAIFVAAGAVAEQGFFQYASVIGMISVSLGLINLLPVPVLDGGQILFYLLEGLRGRPLSLELRERVQMVGVVGLVILMLLVTVNDVQRWVGL